MRRIFPVVVFVLGGVAAGPAAFWQDKDEGLKALDEMSAKALAEWPKRLIPPFERTLAEKLLAEPGTAALPAPSLTEPFEIGEALNDPNRVEDAVMSMLGRMNIGVISKGAAMRRVTGRERLLITEAEARTLIEMGKADAANADAGEFSFADLYRSVSPFVPRSSVEQVAERYAKVYESRQDSLVPQLLQGRPIEPEAPLLRLHLWLLLADGIVRSRPDKAVALANGPRLVFVSSEYTQPAATSWGTGILQPDWRTLGSPQMQLSDAEWEELVVRLPLFISSDLLSMTPTQPRAHEKHGGAGAAVPLEARLTSTPPAMVSSLTGRTLLSPRQSSLAGVSVSWRYSANLLDHGAMSEAEGVAVRVGADGVARLVYDPKAELANGRGALLQDHGPVEAFVRPAELLAPLYNVPTAANALAWGERRVGGVELTVGWHEEGGAGEVLAISLHNRYSARILGALQRDGVDWAFGDLRRAADGTYRGRLLAYAVPFRTVLPLKNCQHPVIFGLQFLDVIATPISEHDSPGQRQGAFYNAVRSSPKFFQWDSGTPQEYLGLEFFPATPPKYFNEVGMTPASRPVCEDEIGGPIGPNGRTPNFIPLNAAQWTIEHAGYALAIPAVGQTLAYRDLTNAKANLPTGGLAGAIAKLAAGTDSTWRIWVRRLSEP